MDVRTNTQDCGGRRKEAIKRFIKKKICGIIPDEKLKEGRDGLSLELIRHLTSLDKRHRHLFKGGRLPLGMDFRREPLTEDRRVKSGSM